MSKLALISENVFTDVCICQNLATWIFWICPIYCMLIFILVQLCWKLFSSFSEKMNTYLKSALILIQKKQNQPKPSQGDWVSLENALLLLNPASSALVQAVLSLWDWDWCICCSRLGVGLALHSGPFIEMVLVLLFVFPSTWHRGWEVNDWLPPVGGPPATLLAAPLSLVLRMRLGTLKAGRSVAPSIGLLSPQNSLYPKGKSWLIQHWGRGSLEMLIQALVHLKGFCDHFYSMLKRDYPVCCSPHHCPHPNGEQSTTYGCALRVWLFDMVSSLLLPLK